MKEVHIVVGALAIGLSAGAGLLGAWCWWRAAPNRWFWRLLRSSQVVIVFEAALGGVLELTDRKAPGIHVVYGLLPLAVSFIGEQLRAVSAQMILDARGIPSAAAVGELPAEDQQRVVVAIVQREIGVMALAALVIVVLLARAAGTA
jgi:hypothetical protein